MVYKEVLTDIEPDTLLLAGDRTFERAPVLNKITDEERKLIAAEFKALTGLSWVVRVDKLLRLKRSYGGHLAVGTTRFTLALKEYFDTLEREGELDTDSAHTRLWLQSLDKRRTYAIARSYLRQQNNEGVALGLNHDGAENVTAEEVKTTEEYPAFADLADLLEDRLLETGVDDDEAFNISSGALLGAIVVREEIELRQIHTRLSYVAEA